MSSENDINLDGENLSLPENSGASSFDGVKIRTFSSFPEGAFGIKLFGSKQAETEKSEQRLRELKTVSAQHDTAYAFNDAKARRLTEEADQLILDADNLERLQRGFVNEADMVKAGKLREEANTRLREANTYKQNASNHHAKRVALDPELRTLQLQKDQRDANK